MGIVTGIPSNNAIKIVSRCTGGGVLVSTAGMDNINHGCAGCTHSALNTLSLISMGYCPENWESGDRWNRGWKGGIKTTLSWLLVVRITL